MNNTDQQYLTLLNKIVNEGVLKESGRPGMPNTIALFGHQMRFNLSEGFPLLTTKKLNFKNIAVELLWFLKGNTNIQYLIDNGCNIWNDDAYRHYCTLMKNKYPDYEHLIHDKEKFLAYVISGISCKQLENYKWGDLGDVYGKQWRDWNGIDQIENVITNIKKNPYGRRHIVSAWNPEEVDSMALPPCHVLFQFNCRPISNDFYQLYLYRNNIADLRLTEVADYVEKNKLPKFYLDLSLVQRSCDTFLGVPYNIASYALLLEIVSKMCNMKPGTFIWTGNDVHIYDNHEAQVKEQLTREPKLLPVLELSDVIRSYEDPAEIKLEDLHLIGYEPHSTIKGELSVGI